MSIRCAALAAGIGALKMRMKSHPYGRRLFYAARSLWHTIRELRPAMEEAYVRVKYGKGELQTVEWNGFRITETRYDSYARDIVFGRVKELVEQAGMFRFLIRDERPVIFDVGANIGIVSLLSSRIHGAAVYAFEPARVAFSCLRRNIEQNHLSNVRAINMGLSDREGELFIGPPSADQHPRYRRRNLKTGLLSVHADPESDAARRWGEMARFTTLDAFCARNGIERIHYLKIDVEGHENKVLEGGRGMLRKTRPICQIELNTATMHIAGTGPAEVFAAVLDLGYITCVCRQGQLVETSLSDLLRGRPHVVADIYALPWRL